MVADFLVFFLSLKAPEITYTLVLQVLYSVLQLGYMCVIHVVHLPYFGRLFLEKVVANEANPKASAENLHHVCRN